MEKPKLKIKSDMFNPVFLPILDRKERYLHLFGGRASGKSVFAAQWVVLKTFKTLKNGLIFRQVKDTLHDSVYAEILNIIDEWELKDYFHITKSPLRIRNKKTGSELIFRGFDDPNKLKSISNIGFAWGEELLELQRLSEFQDLDSSLREAKGEDPIQIVMTYNPLDKEHWLNKEFHQTKRDDTFLHLSTYRDNHFLNQEEFQKRLETLKATNPNKYNVYANGEWGQVQEGEIIKKEWFRYFKASDIPEGLPRHFYTDSAHGQENSDQTASICWSEYQNNMYVWSVMVSKRPFTEWIRQYKSWVKENNGSTLSIHRVENKASGFEIEDVLRTETDFNIRLDKLPGKDSKRMRAEASAPTVYGGRVYLLEGGFWVDGFLYEVCAFPDYKYDDQVDILSSMVRVSGSIGGEVIDLEDIEEPLTAGLMEREF